MKLTGENRSTRGNTCPSATVSTTNPIWTDPGSNPGLRGERPATNRRYCTYINVKGAKQLGHAVAQLVEALRYKLEGRGFDSRWCHWNFSLT